MNSIKIKGADRGRTLHQRFIEKAKESIVLGIITRTHFPYVRKRAGLLM